MSKVLTQAGSRRGGVPRWVVSRRGGLLLIATFLASGCYASTGYDAYPKGKLVHSASLVRDWVDEETRLTLNADGSFSADRLSLEYFECSASGVQTMSGAGTWSTVEGRESTSVLLGFSSGCSATLWAGESSGKAVLWSADKGGHEGLVLQSVQP